MVQRCSAPERGLREVATQVSFEGRGQGAPSNPADIVFRMQGNVMIEGSQVTNSVEVKNQRRSERVTLRVPVSLAVRLADGQSAREDAFTNVVSAHGGLIVTKLHLGDSQLFDLTNSKTGATRQCSVVHSEKTEQGFSIAFQFQVPAPNFWPIAFPPADWQNSTT